MRDVEGAGCVGEGMPRTLLRRCLHAGIVAVLVVLQVVFLGGLSSAGMVATSPVAQMLLTNVDLAPDDRKPLTFNYAQNPAVGTGTNATVTLLCDSSLANVATLRANFVPTMGFTAVGATYSENLVTGSAGVSSGSYTWTAADRCPDPHPYLVGLHAKYASSSTASSLWIPEADSSTCSQGTLTNVTAGIDTAGARIGVRFQWTGSITSPKALYVQLRPTMANVSTDATSFTPVSGEDSIYWWRGDNTAGVTAGATVRVAIGNATTVYQCRVNATVGTSLPVTVSTSSGGGGPTDYGDGDDGEGNDCSSWDLFCRLKGAMVWAFMPADSTLDEFTAMGDDIGEKIPFVYIDGAVTLFNHNFQSCSETGLCTGWSYDGLMTFDLSGITGSAGGTTVLPEGDPIADWMQDHRLGLSVFMYLIIIVPFAIFVWKKLLPLAGGGNQ